jgi:hypothetical protein
MESYHTPVLEFALSQLSSQINRIFGVAIKKAKDHFLMTKNALGFLTNIVSAVDGSTSLAIVKHIKHMDADSFEAILPFDVAGETHWISYPESEEKEVPARIKAVVSGREVDLFDLRRAKGTRCRSHGNGSILDAPLNALLFFQKGLSGGMETVDGNAQTSVENLCTCLKMVDLSQRRMCRRRGPSTL